MTTGNYRREPPKDGDDWERFYVMRESFDKYEDTIRHIHALREGAATIMKIAAYSGLIAIAVSIAIRGEKIISALTGIIGRTGG